MIWVQVKVKVERRERVSRATTPFFTCLTSHGVFTEALATLRVLKPCPASNVRTSVEQNAVSTEESAIEGQGDADIDAVRRTAT